MYKRTIYDRVKNSLRNYPVVLITGARQVGKSTLAYRFVEEMGFRYISLDNITYRKEALEDPQYFIQKYGYPLIIDEIQYAPELMEVIESAVNEKRLVEGDANGMYILTGSQIFSLMKGVTQSLAGRISILNMEPLSYNEIRGKKETPFLPSTDLLNADINPLNVNDLYKLIVRGFYPELYKNKNLDTFEFYENYVSTYIDRDISDLINVHEKMAFHSFLQYIATLTSQQINYSDISKNLGINTRTIKSWISLLEASGIIYFLQPYSEYTLTKRVTKAPKLYFSDTGLAAHLARVDNPEYLMVSPLAGAFMETYTINEIKKSYESNGRHFDGYFYRDNHQNEIDLILLENLKIHCIEIKKGSMFNKSHIKAFDQLKDSQYQLDTSCILCNSEKAYFINRDVFAVNVTSI